MLNNKFLLPLLILMISCSSITPDTEITVVNAGDVTSFEETPESIVMYFYASKIRKDNDWEKVCIPERARSSKFTNALGAYESWIFTKYRFVSKEEFAPDVWSVTIYMEISMNGQTDSGTDQVKVEKVDGSLFITEVPT